jgi:hypothetical protein
MNRAFFFSVVRRTLFGGKLTEDQVKGMKGILDAFDEVGDKDQDTLAYALATAYYETGSPHGACPRGLRVDRPWAPGALSLPSPRSAARNPPWRSIPSRSPRTVMSTTAAGTSN